MYTWSWHFLLTHHQRCSMALPWSNHRKYSWYHISLLNDFEKYTLNYCHISQRLMASHMYGCHLFYSIMICVSAVIELKCEGISLVFDRWSGEGIRTIGSEWTQAWLWRCWIVEKVIRACFDELICDVLQFSFFFCRSLGSFQSAPNASI